MKILIAYKTKNGSTGEYASFLSEELKANSLIELNKVTNKDLESHDLIIIGSRTYMGIIQAQKFLKKNWDILKNKKLYLFSVGLIPWEKEESRKSFEMIPEYIRNSLIGYRKLPGRINLDNHNFLEKLILKQFKVGNIDLVKRENVLDIVSDIKKLVLE